MENTTGCNVHKTRALPQALTEENLDIAFFRCDKLLFVAITCRPDILYSIIKVSQYSSSLVEIHYIAVKQVFRFLHNSVEDDLHYWRENTSSNLTPAPLPCLSKDTQDISFPKTSTIEPTVFFESGWVGATSYHRSISGIGLFFASSPVIYCSRFQPEISLSSTEN